MARNLGGSASPSEKSRNCGISMDYYVSLEEHLAHTSKFADDVWKKYLEIVEIDRLKAAKAERDSLKKKASHLKADFDEVTNQNKTLCKKIEKLENKKYRTESDKATDSVTEKIEQQTRMSKDDVSKKFGNKIIFAKNESNNFLHADKGNIDEFIKYAKSTKFFVVSKDPKNKNQFRVFHNRTTLNGLAVAHARKHGWEISQ